MSWKGKVAIGFLVGALVLSLGANYVLYTTGVHYYREGEAVRLDPDSARHFRPLNEQLEAPKPGQQRVVFLGDSRIERWEPLPAVPGAQLVNRGRGGDTTAQVLLRLERDAVRLQPRLVILQLGINDLKGIGSFPEREQEITDGCVVNLKTIVERLRQTGSRVVVLTIFPVGPIPMTRRPVWSNATLTAVDRVNDAIRKMEGVGVIDCDPVLRVDGRMNSEYALDAFHLTAPGYARLSTYVLLELQRQGLWAAPPG